MLSKKFIEESVGQGGTKVYEYRECLTVSELIEVLQKLPQDAEVHLIGSEFAYKVKEIEVDYEGNTVYLNE